MKIFAGFRTALFVLLIAACSGSLLPPSTAFARHGRGMGTNTGGSGGITAPGTPYGMAAGPTSVRLKWAQSASSNRLLNYTLWYRPHSGGSWITHDIAPENMGTVHGLSNSTSYDFSITGTDEAGNTSVYGNFATISTLASGAAADYAVMPSAVINTHWAGLAGQSGTTYTPTTAAALVTALANCADGDIIKLQHGITYDPSSVGQTDGFVLRNRGAGSGWVFIISDAAPDYGGGLPAATVRVGPGDAANMPLLYAGGANQSSQGALTLAAGAARYRIIGVEFTPVPGYSNPAGVTALIKGSNSATLLSDIPDSIVFDRVLVRGLYGTVTGARHGIALDASHAAVIDSYIDGITVANSSDEQAIYVNNSPGPYKIQNNYLSASSEISIFGGNATYILNMWPTNVQITRNTYFKDPAWQFQALNSKNALEFKSAKQVYVAKNTFTRSWDGGQQNSVSFKSTDQNFGQLTVASYSPSATAATSATLTGTVGSQGTFDSPQVAPASLVWPNGVRNVFEVTYTNTSSTTISWATPVNTTTAGGPPMMSESPWSAVADVFFGGNVMYAMSDGPHFIAADESFGTGYLEITPTTRVTYVDNITEATGVGAACHVSAISNANPAQITCSDTPQPFTSASSAVFSGITGGAGMVALNATGSNSYPLAAPGGSAGAWTFTVTGLSTIAAGSYTGGGIVQTMSNDRPLYFDAAIDTIVEHNTFLGFYSDNTNNFLGIILLPQAVTNHVTLRNNIIYQQYYGFRQAPSASFGQPGFNGAYTSYIFDNNVTVLNVPGEGALGQSFTSSATQKFSSNTNWNDETIANLHFSAGAFLLPQGNLAAYTLSGSTTYASGGARQANDGLDMGAEVAIITN